MTGGPEGRGRRERLSLAIILAVSAATRAFVATRLELSDGEALLWAESVLWPGSTPPPLPAALLTLSAGLLGQTELAVRLPGILLSTLAVAVTANQARDRVLTALLLCTMPLLAVGGLFATAELVLASLFALGLAAALRERWILASFAAIGATLSLPRTGSPFPSEADPGALITDLLFWVTPLTLLAALPLLFKVSRRRDEADPDARLLWWSAWPLLIPALWGWPTAAGPMWAAAAIGVGRGGDRQMRAGWLAAGVAGLTSAVMLVHLLLPLADVSGDPRVQLTGGRVLASSVSAWDAPLVLAEEPADAALLSFYGVPRVFPLRDASALVQRADHALLIRPWSANVPLSLLSRGFDTDGPNDVSAWIDTTDPTRPRLAARWQVYSVYRPGTKAPGL